MLFQFLYPGLPGKQNKTSETHEKKTAAVKIERKTSVVHSLPAVVQTMSVENLQQLLLSLLVGSSCLHLQVWTAAAAFFSCRWRLLACVQPVWHRICCLSNMNKWACELNSYEVNLRMSLPSYILTFHMFHISQKRLQQLLWFLLYPSVLLCSV